jgi:hypothetical protein
MPTLTAPHSPGARARSVSQPLREGIETDFFAYVPGQEKRPATYGRSNSASNASGSFGRASGAQAQGLLPQQPRKGRARSGSLVTVTEVGGDEPDTINDRVGVSNHNAGWVNSPGAWVIHPVLILAAKLLIDAIPGVDNSLSWTIVNVGYMILSFIMFHHVTGMPFETAMSTGGAYDELTLWEQIDGGAQYTPAKKWLTSVPIGLFLISTHYSNYDYNLFAINFTALIVVLFPKLPILHRQRIHFLQQDPVTPSTSRPPSPGPKGSY